MDTSLYLRWAANSGFLTNRDICNAVAFSKGTHCMPPTFSPFAWAWMVNVCDSGSFYLFIYLF